MIVAILVVLGLVLGSFANATIWRLHAQDERESKSKKKNQIPKDADLSILTGRSICTHCGHVLSAWDLVPVVSYLYLRGKCRYCHKPIEDTPVAELLTALVFVISYVFWPYDLHTAGLTEARVLFGFWLLFLVGFVILALYDLRWYLLPDRVVFPLIGVAVIQTVVRVAVFHESWVGVADAGWGVLLTAGLFYLLYLASRRTWIGFGDVKLAIVLGLLVGGPFSALLLIFLASVLGSLVALPLLIQGKAVATTRIPFGPFLLVATVVVILAGSYLINWYFKLLNVPMSPDPPSLF